METVTALGRKFLDINIPNDRYARAACENKTRLSYFVRSAFHAAQRESQGIKPVFLAAATGVKLQVDKLAQMGALGMGFADKPWMRYGGNNLVLGMQRKVRRIVRDAQLKCMGFVYQ